MMQNIPETPAGNVEKRHDRRGQQLPANGSGILAGKIALVAGGTRGAGRGIAVELGAA
mgnify:CR=1 FL=1